MVSMVPNQETNDEDRRIRTIDRPDSTSMVVDLGTSAGGSVDIVDGTAIVVIGEDQYDIDLTGSVERAALNNGILTIDYGETA